MLCLVLKAFVLSNDGINSRSVAADEIVEVRDDLTPGLMTEGFVALVATAASVHETKVIESAPETGATVPLTEPEIVSDLEGSGAAFDIVPVFGVRPEDMGDVVGSAAPLEPAVTDEAPAPVDIPANWSALHWTKRVKLARELGADDISADEANAVIEAALAARAG